MNNRAQVCFSQLECTIHGMFVFKMGMCLVHQTWPQLANKWKQSSFDVQAWYLILSYNAETKTTSKVLKLPAIASSWQLFWTLCRTSHFRFHDQGSWESIAIGNYLFTSVVNHILLKIVYTTTLIGPQNAGNVIFENLGFQKISREGLPLAWRISHFLIAKGWSHWLYSSYCDRSTMQFFRIYLVVY